MATTMTPETPAADPRPAGDLRLSNIRANLMPDEVIIARRTEALRRQIMVGLAAMLGLIIAWYAVSWWQTHSSNGDLDDANRRSVGLTNQQHQFGSLVAAQNQTATITSQLQKLMVGDVQWKTMLVTLRSVAPKGVVLTNVIATIPSKVAVSSAQASSPQANPLGVLNQSGRQPIGIVAITGTASDKKSVAAYVDKLSTVQGLTAPYPANVAISPTSTKIFVFTVNVIITTDALGGRYAVTPTGGK